MKTRLPIPHLTQVFTTGKTYLLFRVVVGNIQLKHHLPNIKSFETMLIDNNEHTRITIYIHLLCLLQKINSVELLCIQPNSSTFSFGGKFFLKFSTCCCCCRSFSFSFRMRSPAGLSDEGT